ncbi:hypothetical protein ACIQGZ_16700 [Streptomyces sp. NPDC092296]|uniref:hypothetical protein n=1 Tax=Streptomyces sp. NPDC092296 TaxID=3366012 RepID=UPI00380688FF
MRTRVAVSVVAVMALLPVAAGCSAGSGRTAQPPSAAPGARRSAPARSTDDVRAGQRAAAALTGGGLVSGTDAVGAGSGALDGMDRDETIGKGRRLVIEAACVGRGSMTVTASSGRATAHRVVPCGDTPQRRSFTFTTAAAHLDIERRAGQGASGGAAYLVRAAG